MFSTYPRPFFKRHINPADVRCIFEVGSRDGLDAILLTKNILTGHQSLTQLLFNRVFNFIWRMFSG